MSYVVIALALVVLSLIFRNKWVSTREVVYRGNCVATTIGVDDLGKRSNTRYCWVMLPDGGKMHLAEIPLKRFEGIKGGTHNVSATIVKYAFGSPFVESIRWAEGEAVEPADQRSDGLALTAVYFIAAMASLGLAVNDAASQAVLLVITAAFLALAGAVLNLLHDRKPVELKEAAPRIAGVPLGKGMFSMLLLFGITLILTIATFSSFSLFTLFPGIHAAFALGATAAIVWKAQQTENSSSKVEKS